ncbi:hypothetical protein CASFOL_002429 [Castilleja foliolosa]|uniref:Pop1 N-terminal domain-containing protein n=1 Tax=Castilleja foliolosa TaxID=1961234 RepID=A0ABD3EEA4_9LAMI
MVNNESRSGVSAAAPHELSVWKFVESRASELESLHTIISERLDNNFRSQRNKRRRTTGHDNRVAKRKLRKRRRVGVGNIGETNLASKDGKKVTRRVRRNIELKKNLSSCFGTSGDGTKRLRTHVWHAKRFTMKKLWGFYIPLGLHGRGRGSRSLLKKLEHGVLMHDASYYGPVQLEGPQDTLMSVLSSVLVPSAPSGCEETSHNILAGSIFGSAMLHHAGKPCFPPIAPVTYMWQSQNGKQNVDDGTIIRQLWVWVHAAAFEEAYDSLRSACAKQTNTARSAHCVSREGHLAKLELVGSKVFELLQKALIPTNCNSEKALIFENGHQISSNAVVSVVVKDPRTSTKKENVIVPEEKTHGLVSNDEFEIKEQTSSSLPKHETECLVQYSDLWDASKEVCPPVEESVLCMEKHHQRKDFIRLGHKSSGPKSTVHGEYSRECPVVLLKNETNEDSVTCANYGKEFMLTAIEIREGMCLNVRIQEKQTPMLATCSEEEIVFHYSPSKLG